MDFLDDKIDIKQWIKTFKILDKDDDGFIDVYTEFREYLLSKKVVVTEEELLQVTENRLMLDVCHFLIATHRIQFIHEVILEQPLQKKEGMILGMKRRLMNWFGMINPEQFSIFDTKNSTFLTKYEHTLEKNRDHSTGTHFKEEDVISTASYGPTMNSMVNMASNKLDYQYFSSEITYNIPKATLDDSGNFLSTKKSITVSKSHRIQEEEAKLRTKALFTPELMTQMSRMKTYRPYFTILATILHIMLMIYALVYNHGFEPMSTNPMCGVSVTTLVQLGAQYVPCMKPNVLPTTNLSSERLVQLCGMSGFIDQKPNQWYRFFTAIFLHSGVIHLVFNLSFQLITGWMIERRIGFIRLAIIYMASGTAGNLFSALMQPNVVLVGASGSLQGLVGIIYLNLFQNWPMLQHPWRTFWLLTAVILISLGAGLLPYIDNYAHIGGMFCGIVAGIIFYPTLIFNKWDAFRKRAAFIVAIPLFIAIFVVGFLYFYMAPTYEFCHLCRWLNCIPPDSDWCQRLKP
jgi:membrane associated rhomboid family serine protease